MDQLFQINLWKLLGSLILYSYSDSIKSSGFLCVKNLIWKVISN